jgi:hypothetical protein
VERVTANALLVDERERSLIGIESPPALILIVIIQGLNIVVQSGTPWNRDGGYEKPD